MKLSKNFSLEELLESQSARRYNVNEQFNPNQEIVNNLKLLVENILQPLRDKVGVIQISSGYRSARVNKIVGGSTSSQHLMGQAADIKGVKVSNKKIFETIINMNLPFDQLIWEYGTKNEPAWVHVSFGPRNRREILYIPSNLKP
jgi:uncharacterized protein YcbK (DUF882 family)